MAHGFSPRQKISNIAAGKHTSLGEKFTRTNIKFGGFSEEVARRPHVPILAVPRWV
jgi:hypothetical protein